MRILGLNAKYVLCDVDPVSAASLKMSSTGLDAQVFEEDGISVIGREAKIAHVNPHDVLVHIDPFDPHERIHADGRTPVELAGWLAHGGFRVVYWYGYDSVEKRGWAYDEIAQLAPNVKLWCGDVLMPASFVYPGRLGAWGCGIVLANMTSLETQLCEQLGQALERISNDDRLDQCEPCKLTFQVFL